ncbi:hypothetical protein LTR37_000062 [Vermiconidia calcicola]|uniref:Uncharacterized protein n=1 Tax=Vermiconidia calcicola TaxID=1690605 RepID=A0ACC3NZF7_9PEZI|nr:hypothetical protein LTR37_000062 [Vermiconidia calcicola]
MHCLSLSFQIYISLILHILPRVGKHSQDVTKSLFHPFQRCTNYAIVSSTGESPMLHMLSQLGDREEMAPLTLEQVSESVSNYTSETFQQITYSTNPTNNSETHPHQSPASKMAGSFECQVCLYGKQENNPLIIDDCPVCDDCVKESILPLFHRALEHEHDYPPRWGTTQLNPADFLHLLGKNFLDRYRRREVEYQSVDRIYCKHKVRADAVPPIGEAAPLGKVFALKPDQINQADLDGVPMVECGALASGRLHRQAARPGSCPRWNHPDDENAFHDDEHADHDDEDDPMNAAEFFNEIVARGHDLIAGGGQINPQWLQEQVGELAGLDVRGQDLLGGMNVERVWQGLVHVQRIFANTAHLAPVIDEISAWAERQGLTEADQAMQQMLQLGAAVVGNHATHQAVIARPEEPPQDIKEGFADAVALGAV